MLIQIAEGTKAIIDAATYKASYEKIKKEVDRKEAVIVSQIEKNKICYSLADNLKEQMKAKDEVITKQDEFIKKHAAKPKYWNVSLSAGYGYGLSSTVRLGGFIGVTVGRTLFKF